MLPGYIGISQNVTGTDRKKMECDRNGSESAECDRNGSE